MYLEEGKVYLRKATKDYPLVIVEFIRYEMDMARDHTMVKGRLLHFEKRQHDAWYKKNMILKFHNGEWREITPSELSAYLM